MNLKDKDCPEFKELSRFVFEGEYEQIDNWFKEHEISKKPALERELTLRILNATYFFSFRSFATSRQAVQEQRTKREVAILKNLKCENQIKLFSVASIDEVNHEHFEVIKLTKKNKELLQNSASVTYVLTKLFNEEDFLELDKIEKRLKRPILEQSFDGVSFFYREKNSRGTTFFKVDEHIFAPKHDIVFNYTESKKEYLDSKGIALPTVEEATYLHQKILKAINEKPGTWRVEDVEKINQAVKNYKIQKNYLDLNSDLENSNKTNKKLKI